MITRPIWKEDLECATVIACTHHQCGTVILKTVCSKAQEAAHFATREKHFLHNFCFFNKGCISQKIVYQKREQLPPYLYNQAPTQILLKIVT